SIFGCLHGTFLAASRVPFAMAGRGAFPLGNIFSRQHPKLGTPVPAIILVMSIATIMVLMLNPDRITDIAIFSMYIFYCILFLSVFRVRKMFGVPAQGSYRIPLYPVVPLLGALGGGYICWSMAYHAPQDAALSVVVALLGLPLYLLMTRTR
ncbi:MAG: APC family permease, partial [Oligoflexales bacterium]|nr:APC family permease [Oligoflexales bacterium]